jgi:uncharacterized cupredoxin-like copper-binding protein
MSGRAVGWVASVVTFRMKTGKLAHDFKMNGVTSKIIAPGGSASITVNFKQKGACRYLWTIPGHAQLGFRIT